MNEQDLLGKFFSFFLSIIGLMAPLQGSDIVREQMIQPANIKAVFLIAMEC